MPQEAATQNPFMDPLGRSLSMERTSEILGISRRTVYYWIKGGRLQSFKTRCGSQRVLTDSVKTVWHNRG